MYCNVKFVWISHQQRKNTHSCHAHDVSGGKTLKVEKEHLDASLLHLQWPPSLVQFILFFSLFPCCFVALASYIHNNTDHHGFRVAYLCTITHGWWWSYFSSGYCMSNRIHSRIGRSQTGGINYWVGERELMLELGASSFFLFAEYTQSQNYVVSCRSLFFFQSLCQFVSQKNRFQN